MSLDSIPDLTQAKFVSTLKAAVHLDCPYSENLLQVEGGEPTDAAVLILLGWGADERAGPSLLIIKRTETVETHKGQMAFPGGVIDAGDLSPTDGALRETLEEVGIPASKIEVLGVLPPFLTITGYRIFPVVGLLRERIEDVVLVPNPHETAETLWVPYRYLISADVYHREVWRHEEKTFTIHVYKVEPHRIWGATGAMINNFLDRIKTVLEGTK